MNTLNETTIRTFQDCLPNLNNFVNELAVQLATAQDQVLLLPKKKNACNFATEDNLDTLILSLQRCSRSAPSQQGLRCAAQRAGHCAANAQNSAQAAHGPTHGPVPRQHTNLVKAILV